VAGDQGRRGPGPDRDVRGLAARLPRVSHPATGTCTAPASPSSTSTNLEGPGRAAPYVLSPQAPYECVGDVANVVFPCAMLCDEATQRLAIYYGAADTVTAMAFGYVSELVEFAKEHSIAG